jgi:hypothetical protein
MPLSNAVKQGFASSHGFSLEEAKNSISQSWLQSLVGGHATQVSDSQNGRGYVHLGQCVSPDDKDKENLKLLKFW